MSIKNALRKLDEAIDDLSSLHVQTFSGTVKWSSTSDPASDPGSAPGGSASTGTLRTLKTFEGFADKPASYEDVSLVAETLMKFDGDSYSFLASETAEAAMQLHKNAVEAGINTRLGIAKMLREAFSL